MSLRDEYQLQTQIDAIWAKIGCLSCCEDDFGITTLSPPVASPGISNPKVLFNAVTGTLYYWDNDSWVEYGLGWYNVKAFEAQGGGFIDDTAAIQAAIDAADAAGGGVVYFPAGTYAIYANGDRQGLLIGDNTTLLGNGDISELVFHPDALSSTAILNKNSSGALTAAQQRVGNSNISIKGIKVRDTRTTEFLDIGINLSGVDGFLIQDVTVEDVGGYSFLIARTNDDADIGNESKNGVIENIKALNFMDQGLEIWGATNVRVNNVYVSGTGTTTGYGQGFLAWYGAQDITVNNLTVYKVDAVGRNVAAIGVAGWGVTPGTVTGERNTQNIVLDNVNANTDIALRINTIYNVDDAILRVDDVVIRNSVFNGFDAATLSSDIRHIDGLRIENTRFTNFLGHLQFTNPGRTTLQNTVSNVDINNCVFEGGESLEAFGLSNFRFIGNRFTDSSDFPPLIIQGGLYGKISGNTFYNIGSTIDVTCIVLKQLNESSTIETEFIEISNNTAIDDRVSKHTDDLVTLQNATDNIVIRNNSTFFADSDSDDYINTGTGTIIRADSGIYTPNTSVEVNLDAGLSLSDFRYYRQGNMVHVFGRFTANPTAAVLTGFQISIPPAYNSQITAVDELVGVAVSGGTTSMVAEVLGNAGNNTAQVRWIATNLTAQDWSINFAYIVNPF